MTINIDINDNPSRATSALFSTKDQFIELVESLRPGWDQSQGPIGVVLGETENRTGLAIDFMTSLFKAKGKTTVCGAEYANAAIIQKLDDYADSLPSQADRSVCYGKRRSCAIVFLEAVLGITVDAQYATVDPDHAEQANINENVHKLTAKAISAHDKRSVAFTLLERGDLTKEAHLRQLFGVGVGQQLHRCWLLVQKFPALRERFEDAKISLPHKEVAKKALAKNSLEEAVATLEGVKVVPAISKTEILKACKAFSYGHEGIVDILEGIAAGDGGRFTRGLLATAKELGLQD